MKNGPYILVFAPDKYPGLKYRGKYIYEHHLVWWENTETVVPKNYTIHHKNGNKIDNRFENLEVIHKSRHCRLHRTPKKMILLICKDCGIPFQRENRNIEFKIRRGQKNFYCCKEHCQKLLRRSSAGRASVR